MLPIIHNIDINILQMIHNYSKNILFDKIMPIVTLLGDMGFIWLGVSFVLFLSRKYRRIAILSILTLILTVIIGEGILKHLFERARPFTHFSQIELLIKEPLTYSFPSGHTASSFGVAEIIRNRIKFLRVPVIITAFLMAFSRLYLLVHYPSDVIAGALLGIFCAKVVLNYSEKIDSLKDI